MLKLNTKRVGPPNGMNYIQPETARRFHEKTLTPLLKRIENHRIAHGLPMPHGWEEEVEDQICLQLGDDELCHDPSSPAPFRTALQRLGRHLWNSLHAKASSIPTRSLTGFEKAEMERWLTSWEEGIPNWGGCACRQHYHESKLRIPPNYDSGGSFYEWTVQIHNEINQLLGKPSWVMPA